MTRQHELMAVSGLVLIQPADTSQRLTAAQQRFNALSQQVARQQQELATWQHSMHQLQQKVLGELLPLYRQLALLQWQLATRLDEALTSYKLGKREQARLQLMIAAVCDNVLAYTDDPQLEVKARQLQQLYSQRADIAGADALAVAPEIPEQAVPDEADMRQYLLLQCGIDCDGMLFDDMQALYVQMQQLEQQQHQATQFQQQRQQARQQQRKSQAQEQAAQQSGALASKSLKLVYQRLASLLHPDREPDTQQKMLKTGLMQQATDAYQAKDLIALLGLQQKAQQLTATRDDNRLNAQSLSGLLDKQLEAYILNLDRQSSQLAEDILACKQQAAEMVNYPHYYRAKPKDILDRLKQAITYQQHLIQSIQLDLQQLTDADSIKRLIQQYRM